MADVSSLTPLQALNYLLNQDYVRNCTDPTLEYVIQNAIWYFTDGRVTPQDADWVNAQDVQAIVNDVLTNAPNYVPKCGDLAAVIINPQYLTSDPTNSKYFENQHLAMGVALGCTTSLANCETAWAQDKCDPRFRTGWGSYFQCK